MGVMKGPWGLGVYVWYGDVFVVGVLDDMVVVVSGYSVCWFLGDCRLLSAASRGLNWRGDMGSPKESENTHIFNNEKKARRHTYGVEIRTCGVEIRTNEYISPLSL